MRFALTCTILTALLACAGARAADQVGDGVDVDPGPRPKGGVAEPMGNPGELAVASAEDPAVPKARNVFAVNMEDFAAPSGLVNERARKAYDHVEALKKQIMQLSADMDDGGRERTRLIEYARLAEKTITEINKLWPEDEDLHVSASGSKRCALVLEEQLTKEPRRWSHVRIAFSELMKEAGDLRRKTVALADDEPRPVVGKDGKIVSIEAPRDPVEAERRATERRRKFLEEAKERAKKYEEETRKKEEAEDDPSAKLKAIDPDSENMRLKRQP
ncbi:MAG: hypothetical protein KIS92_18670 [Planctomycetota bacterium]|nr:hypothetical protein [Planctomycetota bacterium]